MATILLQAAGGIVGGILGGPFGAILGRAAGGLAGASIDAALFGSTRRSEGPRLGNTRIMEADEGAGIARIYGTVRVAGQVIWTTRFEEVSKTERQGGKGGAPKSETTTYSYYGNVAIGLCEGPIAAIRRVWADGEEMDLTEVSIRVYPGGEGQAPDPLIEAKQGIGNAPAYRGLAYVVFERMALERWGNRIPQLSCEVLRPIGRLERDLRAITIIPGASEHGLDPLPVRERLGRGEDRLVNRNVLHGASDWDASLDELVALCPKLERAALVVSWFGDDLRAGQCRLRPGIEIATRDETEDWAAGGVGRDGARLVSRIAGGAGGTGPAFGGTPSDRGVMRAIADLKARGLKVTYYPFILMDVPPGNGRPDPYGADEQAAFAWRGRMTLDVATERAGTADGTASARADIEAFLGTAARAEFSIEGGRVAYHGTDGWSYRRMILSQAALAAAAGVDAFVIGSEMRGLTRIRDEEGRFPFVEGLTALAVDVKAMMPGAVVTYAADWSEYFGYQPADGSGDVHYNLDPLWASPSIDVVGIDNYLPLSDWRDGDVDAPAGADTPPSQYDRDALVAGMISGEYYDWYYASEADRSARVKTPIADGAHGKPWVYRAKDVAAWWSNVHIERRGGVETGGPTAWVPGSKPIWFTELGCPAIDKGANQPNVFVDPKSSESLVPHFSASGRDDLMQRRLLEAQLEALDPASPGLVPALNPVSPATGLRMLDAGAIHVWTWDARPYPAFPERSDVWSDGGNWRLGHWLTGRLGDAPADALIAAILADHGIERFDVSGVEAALGGYVVAAPSSARGAIEELMRLTGTVAGVSGASAGTLAFAAAARLRAETEIVAFADGEGPYVELRRGDAGERPEAFSLSYLDPARAYQPGEAEAVRSSAVYPRKEQVGLPVVLDGEVAAGFAASMLREAGAVGQTASFGVAPSDIALQAGDVVTIAERPGSFLITRIETGEARRIEARRLPEKRRSPAARGSTTGQAEASPRPPRPVLASRPFVTLLDLPLPDGVQGAPGGAELIEGARCAVRARPFAGYAVAMSRGGEAFRPLLQITRPATTGRLVEALMPGPQGRLDRASQVVVDLDGGELSSIGAAALLEGGNLAAIECAGGLFEVIQFQTAQEIAPDRYRLTGLLRAQGGTEDAMAAGAAAGADFVLLDAACEALGLSSADVGREAQFRVAPLGRALDDPATVVVSATLGARSVRPLSPVHLTARFAADGAVAIGWTRRTRIGGDHWDAMDVPLGEASELYRVTVSDGQETAPARNLVRDVATPGLFLDAAAQLEGLGQMPALLRVAVAQVSPVWGAGTARSEEFPRPTAPGA